VRERIVTSYKFTFEVEGAVGEIVYRLAKEWGKTPEQVVRVFVTEAVLCSAGSRPRPTALRLVPGP